ncbi:GSCOCG00007485001-RA-CDS [Cotesia congregata]|uniref:Cysteine-rich protein 1 n=1 Tax=Cotesia congregata TaxID=51543 RepID=A0A8J2E117_COTCN|nr:GSCOCG00007485001-RA-CDS [Cotesia congregata]CAG5073630.1 Similar to Crip2: Cysteine-rich protein 2 (Rattus norvegicus) [Cotesia congregata]
MGITIQINNYEIANGSTFTFIWQHCYRRILMTPSKAERKTSMGKDWHGPCLRCEHCNKTLVVGQHNEHGGKPYCQKPCYQFLFGPEGCGNGRNNSYDSYGAKK